MIFGVPFDSVRDTLVGEVRRNRWTNVCVLGFEDAK
jgi:hypothetical protein